jgi:CBS domain-containing protein
MDTFRSNKERVAVVLNEQSIVVGVVSQGDIIKALTSGIDLNSQINKIYNPSFMYLNEYDLKKAYGLFKKRKITLVPIVDSVFKLIGVITLDDIFSYLEENKT